MKILIIISIALSSVNVFAEKQLTDIQKNSEIVVWLNRHSNRTTNLSGRTVQEIESEGRKILSRVEILKDIEFKFILSFSVLETNTQDEKFLNLENQISIFFDSEYIKCVYNFEHIFLTLTSEKIVPASLSCFKKY